MAYFVNCPCGERLAVKATIAGSTIQCACGRDVPVPRLSELRQAAGQGAFEAGIVDTIRRMIADGELPPWNAVCCDGQHSERPCGGTR
jgi:hypothetical protein